MIDFPEVLSAIRQCLPDKTRAYSLHEPAFQGNEWKYVKDCLDTGWVSSVGKYVDEFERKLAEYTGSRFAVATVNGTAALHVSLILAGVQPGDEVLVPTLTFVATTNAVAYAGATPHLVDCDEVSLGVDPVRLENYLSQVTEMRSGVCFNRETGRIVRALVVMHTFGFPADLDRLEEVVRQFGIVLIEDAAESLGSLYKGTHTGTRGRLACLSFNGNKTVTTGGGGAILTSDEELARKAKHLTTTAKQPHRWAFEHDQLGFNYRMPNINAALGCAQLEQLDEFVRHKRALAEKYAQAFSNVKGVRYVAEPAYAKSNYWLNAILLDRGQEEKRDPLMAYLHDHKILVRPAWQLMHRLPMYKNSPAMELLVAESIEARLINLPSSAFLGAGV